MCFDCALIVFALTGLVIGSREYGGRFFRESGSDVKVHVA